MFYRIISAQESKERRKEVSTEVKKLGLEPLFFDAIMGKDYTQDELNTLALPNNGMTPGEIGCALSHVGVLKDFLSSDEMVALVMEDDIDVQKSFDGEDLSSLIEWFRNLEEPTILLLYSSGHSYSKCSKINGIDIYKAFTGSMAHAYLINREAAEIVVKMQTPIRFEIDIFKYYKLLGGVNILALDKNYILQQGFDSYIEKERVLRSSSSDREKKRKNTYKQYYKSLTLKNKCRMIKILIQKSIWEIFFKKKGIQYRQRMR